MTWPILGKRVSRRTAGLGLHFVKGLKFRRQALSLKELYLFSQRDTNSMKETDILHTT